MFVESYWIFSFLLLFIFIVIRAISSHRCVSQATRYTIRIWAPRGKKICCQVKMAGSPTRTIVYGRAV
jgi:hypothetical protein